MTITRRTFLARTGAGIALFGAGAATGIYAASGRGWRIGSDIPRALHVETDVDLPAEADVVVVGAGIAGISTALFLREKGMSVVVCEKGYVAGEQSSRAFGWIYSNGWHHEKLELANQAKRLWQGFGQRFGTDVGFRQSGNFMLLKSDEDVAAQEEWLKEALRLQPDMDARIVSGTELDGLIPGASGRYRAALYQASDGTAEPTYSVPLIARGARSEGVKIVAPCAVRGIETEAGRVSHVVTELGAIRTRNVVMAGGAWTRLLCGNLDVDLPQLGIASSLQRLSQVQGPPGAGYGEDYAWRRHANGEYTLGTLENISPITADSFKLFFDFLPALRHSGSLVRVRFGKDFFDSLGTPTHWSNDQVSPFEKDRFLSASILPDEIERARRNVARAFPVFADATVREEWAGVIDATPDSTPVISDIPGRPGLFLNTGFSGNGLTTAPAAGQLIAEVIAGEKTTVDPKIYRYSRFSDGSELTFRH